MSLSAAGRFSVLVPAYQCADRFAAHVDFLRKLRPHAAELIWAVTESPDGTHELARRAHAELGGKFLTTPSGLYASWNAGIREVTSEFLYISTVSETITAEGIGRMISLLQEHRAQVCFSPPEILPANPRSMRSTRHWPVFRFRKVLERFDQKVVPVPVLAGLQTLSGISGVLGSCASCVFTTKVLRDFPFPTDFLHYGDTAWFYANLCRLRSVYHGRACSTFHVHDFSKRKILKSDITRCVERLASEYRKLDPTNPLPSLLIKLQYARDKTDDLRKPHPIPFWWLSPAAWFWRVQRDLLKKKALHFIKSNFS